MPLLFIVALRLFLALAEEFYDATPLALERSSKGIRPRRWRDGTELLDKWLGVVLAHRKINRLVVSVAFTIYKTGINRRGWWDNKGGCSWLHLVFNCRWHKPTNAGTVRGGVFCVLQGGS